MVAKGVSSKDVAKEAGVSQATVSYVLNNTQGVKIRPETRESVLAAAERLGYHPNLIARSMRLKKSMSIAVVSDKDVTNLRFMQVLEGIKDSLVPRNYSLTLCFDKWQESSSAEHMRYYASNRVDGVIFVFASVPDDHYAYLTEHGVPFVVIHSNTATRFANLVKSNLEPAIFDAVSSIKRRGISEVGYLGHSAGNASDRRFSGYVKALELLGLPVDGSLYLLLRGGDGDEAIEVALEHYLDDHPRLPRAILCESSGIGFGLLRYALQRGIGIPDRLSVVAIGTSRFSSLSCPTLSAIEGPLYEMGAAGCQMLFEIIEGRSVESPVSLDWSFVPRESS